MSLDEITKGVHADGKGMRSSTKPGAPDTKRLGNSRRISEED